MAREATPQELVQIRPRLSTLLHKAQQEQGRRFWRSLEELCETPEFIEYLQREFPHGASEWNDPVGRRRFLKLMGASLALAGLSGCVYQPQEKIVPYIRQPEEIVPGKPLFFATAMPFAGEAIGLLVRSNEGRPTKIEGNPQHPGSLGATDLWAQASILQLYDPDRSRTLLYLGDISSWSAFLSAVRTAMVNQGGKQGAGLRILTETVISPTLADQIKTLLQKYPAAKWHQYEPVTRDNVRLGAQMAFGQPVNTIYRFDQAARVVALDADFLFRGPGHLRYARDFANRRRVVADQKEMNRLYVAESSPTVTGSIADHRLPVKPSEMEALARAIAAGVGVGNVALPAGEVLAKYSSWVNAVVRDLDQHRGASIVVVGDEQPPVVHALGHAINAALGNVGRTVFYTDPVEANPVVETESLRELVADMEAGRVDMLVILGGNPVYTAPADIPFRAALERVPLRIHLGLYRDETADLCHWHVPEAHYLESWSDARAYDGTVSIIQPLIAPLYQGKTAHEILAVLNDQPDRTSYDIVRERWQQQAGAGDFEKWWRRALHDGVVPDTALAGRTLTVRTDFAAVAPNSAPAQGLEIVFRPDPSTYDGRFANLGWLQELPKPLTKLTWDNVIYLSPRTAEKLGLDRVIGSRGGEVWSEIVELRFDGRTVRGPAYLVPGHADDCATVFMGYGRERAGRVGSKIGYNAAVIRTTGAMWAGTGAELRRTGEAYQLASTQLHFLMEGRDLVRATTLEEYVQNPEIVHERGHEPPEDLSLYPQYQYDGYRWAMAIDVSACIGCNACIVACQAENNIPVVGKEQVARSREMHWLRVDTYYEGAPENPTAYFQPIPCQQCEKAPCEVVCPVNATVHSAEGLNDMVYNRCVGTRYCSNNCPYKVRRFNYFLYQDWETPTYKMMRNPEVTVRSRGVMEKCTYCVQRIQAAKIEAGKDGRRVRDGEVLTACQAVCPTEAIVFGDLNDPNSRVAKLKAEKRNFSLLGELNVRPRTSYLAALRNPNPELKGA